METRRAEILKGWMPDGCTRSVAFRAFVLTTSRGSISVYPKGIASSSPGLRGTSYPGKGRKTFSNPIGVASGMAATPLGLEKYLTPVNPG